MLIRVGVFISLPGHVRLSAWGNTVSACLIQSLHTSCKTEAVPNLLCLTSGVSGDHVPGVMTMCPCVW